jgi:hypothetical protein
MHYLLKVSTPGEERRVEGYGGVQKSIGLGGGHFAARQVIQ